jgi:hypothetical protein
MRQPLTITETPLGLASYTLQAGPDLGKLRVPKFRSALLWVAIGHIGFLYGLLHVSGPMRTQMTRLPDGSRIVLQLLSPSIATTAPMPGTTTKGKERVANRVPLETAPATASLTENTQGLQAEAPSNGASESLNLSLPKPGVMGAQSAGQPLREYVAQADAPTAWSRFAKKLAPAAEYREERLPGNRVRVYVKGACFEVAESAMQRLDPFRKHMEFVSKCRD